MKDDSGDKFNLLSYLIKVCLSNKIITLAICFIVLVLGVYFAPFDWNTGFPRDPIHVDAIPDIGENQQIVFTDWPGRSPKDIEDQITYPLLTSLMGLPGVKTLRGSSMFGFSTIYVIFNDDIDFYWGRTRILEKLNSLPMGLLPADVKPTLGPDATALGQVFWYTLEGRDKNGNPTGGWDLDELRSLQDWYVKYALLSAHGVSEIASIGGYVKEYQIDVNPDAMRIFNVSINDIQDAVKMANIDVGVKTIEMNGAEYIIRGLGYIKSVDDIENSVIKANNNVPVYIKNVAKVSLGPALRRGLLDKEGAEVVGGVVTIRYGENPLDSINALKKKINEVSPSLPKKTLADGTESQISIVPFYDRSNLIYETLGTLNSAVVEEILIVIIVLLFTIRQLSMAGIISCLLPAAVLFAFVMMKLFNIEANIMSLSGIAIAIGAVDDFGIILCDNIVKHFKESPPEKSRIEVIYSASSEVAGPLLTTMITTVVGFLPVFLLQHSEGKLFRPLAFTKTFTLFGAYILAIFIIPILMYIFWESKFWKNKYLKLALIISIIIGCFAVQFYFGAILLIVASSLYFLMDRLLSGKWKNRILKYIFFLIPILFAGVFAKHAWPAGPSAGVLINTLVVLVPIVGLLAFYSVFQRFYGPILKACLSYRKIFLTVSSLVIVWGIFSWIGINPLFGWLPSSITHSSLYSKAISAFPGIGREFMPALDEGTFLLMPSAMPHASIKEIKDIMHKQDMAISSIPEVISAVGKAGRAETALDPASLAMIETIINYHPEFLSDKSGSYLKFKYNPDETDYFRNENGEKVLAPDGKPYLVKGKFYRDDNNRLIPYKKGDVFRLWRPALEPSLNHDRKYWAGINSTNDIWDEISRVSRIPGVTPPPKLYPIETRIVMLQSGMRATLGVKINGPDLESLKEASAAIEKALKQVPDIKPETVFATRVVESPYLEINIDRKAIARYGLKLQEVLDIIAAASGGEQVTTTVEGRERYPVRVRYQRELRDSPESLEKILITSPDGVNIPLGQLAEIKYQVGPEVINSEDGFLLNYVFFDKQDAVSETQAVEQATNLLKYNMENGELKLPNGVSYRFAGNYENYLRANKTLMIIIPLVLLIIFITLYFQFRSAILSLQVFSGIAFAWAGGFIMLWLYSCSWFLNFDAFGMPVRDMFNIHPVNLSVPVWVGFLALFGIACDDNVMMASYIKNVFQKNNPLKSEDVKGNIIVGGQRRVKACLLTTATTILALMPVLTSTGRGSDVMIPMAIPVVGGLVFVVIGMLITPVLYSITEENRFKRGKKPL